MEKIIWRKDQIGGDVVAQVGSVRMRCWKAITGKSTVRWRSQTTYPDFNTKAGPQRECLRDAKEDTIRLAKESLLDCQASLDVEKANFDLQEIS